MTAKPKRSAPVGWSIPGITGVRGSGFGNEAISWAKAFIGAQELGLRVAHPAWGLNPRQYWRDFGTSRVDWLAHRAVAPFVVDISWPEVRATGFDDYALALRALRGQLPLHRRPLVVRHTSGMAGGFLAVSRARHYLISQILRPPHVADDLYRMAEMPRRDDSSLVAVHVRAGDFLDSDSGPGPGQFNRRIPADWYLRTCRSIRSQLEDRVSFLILTDNPAAPAVRRLVDEVGAVVPPDRRLPLLSDLASMVVADLVVCSVSSMSMLGVFLSGKPYLWYAPHLEETGGWRSVWGGEPDQVDGVTARNREGAATGGSELFRGVAVDRAGRVPVPLVEHLRTTSRARDPRHDLMLYGVLPSGPDRP
jgi:hypothetical protein